MSDATDSKDDIFSGRALSEDGTLAEGEEVRPTDPNQPRPTIRFGLPLAPSGSPVVPPRAPVVPPQPEPPKLEPVFETEVSPAPASNFPAALPFHASKVELVEQPPRPPPDFPVFTEERRFRFSSVGIRWGRWLAGLALLALVALGGYGWWQGKLALPAGVSPAILERVLPSATPPSRESKESGEPAVKRTGTPAPSLVVLSEPSGATVFVGGSEVGKTPWAGDNVWPQGPLQIEVRKAGWRTWRGSAEGGTERTVRATLRRR